MKPKRISKKFCKDFEKYYDDDEKEIERQNKIEDLSKIEPMTDDELDEILKTEGI